MIRQFGRILNLPRHRLIYRVFSWDHALNNSGTINTWSNEVKTVLYEHNMNQLFDYQQIFPVKDVVSKLKLSMALKQQNELKIECENKPKLRTFITFKDYQQLPAYVGKPLSFVERKTISKLRLGILPIRVETARYVRPVLPENQRFCYCNDGNIESEYHVMFVCVKYQHLRQAWLNEISCPDQFSLLTPSEKFKLTLNDPNNVRFTAKYLVAVMDLRRLLNNAY